MWRGFSLRSISFLLLGPLLMNLLYLLFHSWMTLQMTRAGLLPRQLAWIWAVGSAVYSLSAYLAGQWVQPKQARVVVTAAAILISVVGILLGAGGSLSWFLLLAGIFGVLSGHYFVSFQIGMGSVRPFRTLAWTVAFYNMSWGMGCAIGPFLGSWCRSQPLGWLLGLAFAASGIHTALALTASTAPQRPTESVRVTAAFASTRTHRLLGWITITISVILLTGMFNPLWPTYAATLGWSDWQVGVGQLILFLPVPLFAPLWASLRYKLRSPWLLIVLLAIGAGAYAAMPWLRVWPWALVGLIGFGVAHSGVAFHCIYYGNTDPDNAAGSVGNNEALIGLAGVLGPLVLGLLAGNDPTSAPPYLAGGLLFVFASILVIFVWCRRPLEARRPPQPVMISPLREKPGI